MAKMTYSKDLNSGEFAPYYKTYIDKVGPSDLMAALKSSSEEVVRFFQTIPLEKQDYAYATGKWTIKEVLQHIMDTERVFAYRALRFSRNDKTPLQGFDENAFVPECFANTRTMKSLLDEYEKARCSNLAMFASFSQDVLARAGEANGSIMSVRALGFVMVGHEKHHCEVVKSRYL